MTDPALEAILAERTHGIVAVVKRDGHPQLSNILYAWDAAEQLARISTTADRLKARVLRRNPRAALHVLGDHFWSYAVAEGDAELAPVAAHPGDNTVAELADLYARMLVPPDPATFGERMIRERRLVIRLHVTRVYGLARDLPRADVRSAGSR